MINTLRFLLLYVTFLNMPMSEIFFFSNKSIIHTVFAKSICYKILSFLGIITAYKTGRKPSLMIGTKKVLATEFFFPWTDILSLQDLQAKHF